ncbi:MAG: hypothetical protein AAGF85_05315 [Bacteroidota bacterium]
MRVIKEVQHPLCRISYFHWNGKYIVKLEQDNLEQIFKIEEFDVMSLEEVEDIISEDFIKLAAKRFRDMNEDLQRAMS